MLNTEKSENNKVINDVLPMLHSTWDPLNSIDWNQENPTPFCLQRVKKDIFNLYQDPAPGICILPDKDNMLKIHALINGPFDTPYEGGFFYFILLCPPNYPFQPPRVRLMTTSNGVVRFNPNLYKNGKVCLSILGTWQGPKWLPSQSLTSVLISIQSLLNSAPYHNEPGHETELKPNASKYYNDIIKHETLRVAVCENLENEQFLFRSAIASSFLEYYEYYIDTCRANLDKDKEEMNDLLYGDKRGKFKYAKILARLEKLKPKMEEIARTYKPDDEIDDDIKSDLSDTQEDGTGKSLKKKKEDNESEYLKDYELNDDNEEYF